MIKKLLLGDEALALGAIHAGLSGVYAYPGTPSTEITEFIQADPVARQRGVHSRWCTNEKTAMEAALGMSYAGKRALVCMKHVGMNVCADAFVNAAVTGVNGGVVVVAADDPSMHSSQNEQDSRFYAKFAMVPVFEPSNQQETYDMMADAFALSERVGLPVVMRMVTRLAHSRAAVAVAETAGAENALHLSEDRGWVLLPAIARRQYVKLIDKQAALVEAAEKSAYNRLEQAAAAGSASADASAPAGNAAADDASASSAASEKPLTVVACGIAYNYVMEALQRGARAASVLKVSQYPLPAEQLRAIDAAGGKVLVVEDGQPVVEELLHAQLSDRCTVAGRLTGDLPRTGELTPDNVAAALGLPAPEGQPASDVLAARPPQLCPGCGHRDVYTALNKVMEDYPEGRVFGDIGCYTLGALPPFKTLASCVDMGASITMAKGAADAGVFPAVAVIGDSTFTHSGMTGLLDAANENTPITVVLSDNLTTAMTGGQDSAGTSKFEAICIALGVPAEHVKVVVPLPANMEEITRILREELNYKGVSVIIPRRECMQTLRRHIARSKNK